MIKYFSSILIAFILIISCASKDEKLQNYKDYAQKISGEIKFEDGFNTIKVIGERRSIFRSYFVNDNLVFITEDVSIGNRGSSVNQYYFKDDKLIHFNQKTILIKDDSLKISSKTMITLMMYLDGNTILESDHWIGGVKTTVVEKDADQVINQAILLKDLAEKNRPKKK